MTNVVYAVAHHYKALKPHAECKARPLVRVNFARPQYVGMHQPAAQEFYPSVVLAHAASLAAAYHALKIEVESRFNERIIRRTQADS